MNTKQLEQELIAAGFTIGTTIKTDTGVLWEAYKRLVSGKDCLCNDRMPSIRIIPWDVMIGSHHFQSVEFEVTGETKVGWVNFRVYGIEYDVVLSKVDECTETLLKAWNSVAGGLK